MIETASKRYKYDYEVQSSFEARLCAVVLNANGAKKQNKKPFEVDDFLPRKKKPKMTIEQHKEMMRFAVLRAGGAITNNP